MTFRVRSLALLFAAGFLVAASTTLAQPPGPPPGGGGGFRGPGGFGGPGGPGGPGGGLFGLAFRDDIQQELQVVDEQREKLRVLADEARGRVEQEMRGMFEEMRDLGEEDRRARFDQIREKMDAMNAEFEKQLGEVLLPHQLDRLRQIDLQGRIRRGGAQAITGGEIAKALNLTDEQREKLEKRAIEVQEELQAKIRELQADARKKMLDVLTPEQQAKLEKMMGEQFEMPEPNFGGRGRGRFGRGGQDGQGGSDRGDRNRNN